MMLAVADAIARGQLGELVEIEVHLNLVTPWHLFPHLIPNPRVEIVSHSIHYLDTIRALAGDPKGVFARSYAHPSSRLSDTRTTAILDYDAPLRATLSINHHHDFGRRFQDASRSEEHTSELQSLMRISYAVFCLKKKKHTTTHVSNEQTPHHNKD